MAINNPVIADNDIFQNIAVAIQSKDNGGQMAVDQMAGRIEDISNNAPEFEQIVNSTGGIVASSKVTRITPYMFSQSDFSGIILNRNPLNYDLYGRDMDRTFEICSQLKYIILPHLSFGNTYSAFGNYVCYKDANLKLIILNTMGKKPGGSNFVDCYAIVNFIITNNTVIDLINTITFKASSISSGTCNFYVLDSLKEDYKAATNWSTFANQFKGYSEAPNYDLNATYTIGDVCKYNNKLYAWINVADGNSVPTGEVDEYNDWYCVANIEVI